MRMLSLLRHAKSSRDEASLVDFERPLAPRGRKAAPLMGRHMREIGLTPDLVVCSTAVRTRETAKLALPALRRPDLPIVYDDAIYEAEVAELASRLRAVHDDVGHVLMIGHNPGLQSLALLLAGDHLPEAYRALAEKLPTGGLVVLRLDIAHWKDLAAVCGTVLHYATPKTLAAA